MDHAHLLQRPGRNLSSLHGRTRPAPRSPPRPPPQHRPAAPHRTGHPPPHLPGGFPFLRHQILPRLPKHPPPHLKRPAPLLRLTGQSEANDAGGTMSQSPSEFFRESLLPGPRKILPLALLSIGLLAAALASGCGTSGPPISVSLSPSSAQSVQQGQTVSIMANVANDLSTKGVIWSLSGADCTGAGCGALVNQTIDSATYNAPASIPSDLAVTVTATSVLDPSKSASIVITVPATVVTIRNKVTELAAGTLNSSFFRAQFSATIQNDPTAGGVPWTLTVNGTACSPACGTLSSAN